ncbi:hypothetical protein PQ455_00875 [Sphingomonas naphthae]|uniref:SPOR domain-containing protein n=1 Tax=Sphingomonas naphthae TaxID=1813468 RepID=A0ABY7TKQ8_9SPHN|nr:hypothetical protein [Sphingomonas naphthae]WCT73816.1 hypothetical protein PQ455_00875 [Sphingomonas naphthae]
MAIRHLGLGLAAALIAAMPSAASAQGEGGWAFCYVDPPTYQSGSYVYTKVRYIGAGPVPTGEVAAALAQTAPQVAGRQPECWRYADAEVAEQRRQAGMARSRSQSYSILESEWSPRNAIEPPLSASLPQPTPAPAPLPAPAPATVARAPIPASAPTDPIPGARLKGIAEAVAAARDEATPAPAPAPAPAPKPAVAAAAPPPAPAPDAQNAAVTALNAGIVAREAAKMSRADQAQAEYESAMAAYKQRLADDAARNAKVAADFARVQAEYQQAVRDCAAGDRTKCAPPGTAPAAATLAGQR